MSIAKIRSALEIQLATIAPSLVTAYENFPFVPIAGVPYQKSNLLPAETISPTLGDNMHRESGIYQVTLCYPTTATSGSVQGSGAAAAQAELVRNAYRRGSSFSFGGVVVKIDQHPSVATAIIAADRYCLAVRVRYIADVFT